MICIWQLLGAILALIGILGAIDTYPHPWPFVVMLGLMVMGAVSFWWGSYKCDLCSSWRNREW